MLKFILNSLIMFSLAAILYLVAKTLPKVSDDAENNSLPPKPHWVMIYLERIDAWLKVRFEKFLRWFRLRLMKLDNAVSNKLSTFKKEAPKDMKLSSEEKREEASPEDQVS